MATTLDYISLRNLFLTDGVTIYNDNSVNLASFLNDLGFRDYDLHPHHIYNFSANMLNVDSFRYAVGLLVNASNIFNDVIVTDYIWPTQTVTD